MSFGERSGKQPCSQKIETDKMQALMYAHLMEIPHRKSHYKKIQYVILREFGDYDQIAVYIMFRKFYCKKGEVLKMKLKHYYKLF